MPQEDFNAIEKGQRVCIIGWGGCATLHVHQVVIKTTVTQIVSSKDGQPTEHPRRHYRADGTMVGRSVNPYYHTSISAQCQRPKPKG